MSVQDLCYTRRRLISGVMATAVVLVATLLGSPTAWANSSTADGANCRPVSYSVPARSVVIEPVSVPVSGQTWTLKGELCGPAQASSVQVLLSGATYGRIYWNFDMAPDRYSYVRRAAERGIATLNVDRLGIGDSTHPAPELITTATQARLTSMLVKGLREGTFGARFAKVGLLGHSYGSVVALAEAGTFRDVDGVALTGLTHAVSQGFARDFFASLAPARLVEPRFAGLPLGYLTSRPGTRSGFYDVSNADRSVIKRDEQTKQTYTDGENTTFPTALPQSFNITAPVLVMVGDRDSFFCGVPERCDNPASGVGLENTFYPAARSFELAVVPNSGHVIGLQRNAPESNGRILDWLKRNVG